MNDARALSVAKKPNRAKAKTIYWCGNHKIGPLRMNHSLWRPSFPLSWKRRLPKTRRRNLSTCGNIGYGRWCSSPIPEPPLTTNDCSLITDYLLRRALITGHW